MVADRLVKIGGEVHLTVDSTKEPTRVPPRRLPLVLQDEVKEELERLVDIGVITPMDEPSEWYQEWSWKGKASGKLRICTDPRPLNKALKRPHYPLPVIDDVLPTLSNAKVFSVLDARNGFWQLALDEESSKVTIWSLQMETTSIWRFASPRNISTKVG